MQYTLKEKKKFQFVQNNNKSTYAFLLQFNNVFYNKDLYWFRKQKQNEKEKQHDI